MLRRLAESAHQGCLLLTAQAPPELALLAGAAPCARCAWGRWRWRRAAALLQGKGLAGDDDGWQALVARYGGNPLALKVVGETIATVFGGRHRGLPGQPGGRGGVRGHPPAAGRAVCAPVRAGAERC